MKKITKSFLKKENACTSGYEWYLRQGTNDTKKIIKNLLLEDHADWANWTIARLLNRKQKIQYAIFATEQVIEIYEKKYPEDKRPRQAIEAAKLVLKENTKENRFAAYAANAANAAYAAAYASYAAYAADAAKAANAAYAADAADAAAYASNAAYAAAYAAYAANAADAADAADAAAYASYAAYAADAADAAKAANAAAYASNASNAAYAAYAAAYAAYAANAAAKKEMQQRIINYGLKLLESK